MVDVGVREDDRVDLLDGKWQLKIFFARLAAAALEHTAVEQHGLSIHPQNVARSGHFPGGSGELDLHAIWLSSLEEKLGAACRAAPIQHFEYKRTCRTRARLATKEQWTALSRRGIRSVTRADVRTVACVIVALSGR